MRAISITTFAVLGIACATPSHLYAGDPRPIAQLATITEDPGSATEVVSIDDQGVRGDTWYVLPGRHTAVLKAKRGAPLEFPGGVATGDKIYLVATCTIIFEAAAGERYIATSDGFFFGWDGSYRGDVKAWLQHATSTSESSVGESECKTAVGNMFSSLSESFPRERSA